MDQISDNAESITLTYQNCHFSKIARKVFTKFRNVKNVEFYNSEFEEIQEGAFDFIASDISLKIQGSTKPFKLNQDVFVDFKVSNFVLKDVKLQEFTKEALQGSMTSLVEHSGAQFNTGGPPLTQTSLTRFPLPWCLAYVRASGDLLR